MLEAHPEPRASAIAPRAAEVAPRAADIAVGTDLGSLKLRVEGLAKDVPRRELARMLALVADGDRSPEAIRDALSTRLMEVFRERTSRAAFGLLYELNNHHLLTQVASCLRRYGSKADPRDVLQEVFFNVYRYPHRFNCEREDAFRVWSAMIVRNTVLKHLRSQGRGGRMEVPFEDLSDQPEERVQSPLRGVIERESASECGRVYLTYLHLYLQFYAMLSARERKAIHLVEVEELSYRDAADQLGIKLENLKMVIFRARRKIHRSMRRVFDGLPPDCRPAREPKPAPLLDSGLAPELAPELGRPEGASLEEEGGRASDSRENERTASEPRANGEPESGDRFGEREGAAS